MATSPSHRLSVLLRDLHALRVRRNVQLAVLLLGWGVGAGLLLAALWQTAQNITVFLLTLCASAVMTGIAIPLQLARLPESKTMKKIQLHARSEVPEQSADELPQVGALGVARTDLRPVGTVEIAEKRYEAVSAQHLRCGEAVRVTAVQGRRLRVEKADET